MIELTVTPLGWVYIALTTIWTIALVAGMLFLWRHRQLPCVRIRRLPVLFAGLILLHGYGAICLLSNVIGPVVSCTDEFWVMSIYLPFGIAMFQAANSQFLHVATRQKQYANMSTLNDQDALSEKGSTPAPGSRWRRFLFGSDRTDKTDRLMICIGIGMLIQLAVTLFVYFGSRKFHESYGLWDWEVTGTTSEIRQRCSQGWEWWLSIVWQFFWAWIYAPYLLWKSRGIRDAHGWRTQTIACCLVGLPASPLWLTALYAPQMAPINAVFIPPCWFSLCIFIMHCISIGFPIAQVYKTHSLRQETLDAITSWEKRQQFDEASTIAGSDTCRSGTSKYTGRTLKGDEKSATGKSIDSQKSDMFTMVALENALRSNPVPLLQFAALKDFSGENVSFLTHVADWKRGWSTLTTAPPEKRRRNQFVSAVRVYAHFVSFDFSEFPINISSREMKNLHATFEMAASLLFRRASLVSSSGSATPFDDVAIDAGSTIDLKSGVNLDSLGRANFKAVSRVIGFGHEAALANVDIPAAFNEKVFDAAESEIKYLILTNTWPKFVHAAFETHAQPTSAGALEPNWIKRTILCTV